MQVLLVVPRVFRASRVVSGLAAVCARGRRPARSPSAPRASLGASSRSPARPRHRPRAPQPGPPVPPAPSTPVGPVVLMRIHIIAEPTRNFARNSPTSLSNSEIRSLELQRFPTLLKLLLIELRATFPVTSPQHSPVPPTKPHKREKTRPAPLHQHPHAKKFALLASISVHTRNSSPSTAQTAQNQPIFASRANFFALMGAAVTSHHPPTASPETDDTSARTKQPISGHSPPAKASPVSPLPDAMSTAQISRGVRKDSDAGGTLAT